MIWTKTRIRRTMRVLLVSDREIDHLNNKEQIERVERDR